MDTKRKRAHERNVRRRRREASFRKKERARERKRKDRERERKRTSRDPVWGGEDAEWGGGKKKKTTEDPPEYRQHAWRPKAHPTLPYSATDQKISTSCTSAATKHNPHTALSPTYVSTAIETCTDTASMSVPFSHATSVSLCLSCLSA